MTEPTRTTARLEDIVSFLSEVMKEITFLKSQQESLRIDAQTIMLELGLKQFTNSGLELLFRTEGARHSCNYEKLKKDRLEIYLELLNIGIITLSESRGIQTLIVKQVKGDNDLRREFQ